MAEDPVRHLVAMSEVLQSVTERIDRLSAGGGQPAGVGTGYTDLDWMLGGLRRGTVTVVAGIDDASTQAFAVGVLAHAVGPEAIATMYCSSRTNRHHVGGRLLAAMGRVPWTEVWLGDLTDEEASRLADAAGRLRAGRLSILDHPLGSVEVIVEALEMLTDTPARPELVLVDRFADQMVAHRPDDQVVTEVGRLRDMAITQHVAVLVIETLVYAEASRRTDHRPGLGDLPRANTWISAADAIVLVHDDAAVDPASPDRGTVELDVVMNHHGPTGMSRIGFLEAEGLLSNLQRDGRGRSSSV